MKKIKNYSILIVLCICVIVSGCAQWTLTGQDSLWKVKEIPNKGEGIETPKSNLSNFHELVGIYTISGINNVSRDGNMKKQRPSKEVKKP